MKSKIKKPASPTRASDRVKRGDFGVVRLAGSQCYGRLGYYDSNERQGAYIAIKDNTPGAPFVIESVADLRRPGPAVAMRWLRGMDPNQFGALCADWKLRAEEIGTRKRVRGGDYGVVLVVEGPFSGKLALYDNDETRTKVVIYLLDPLEPESGYYVVPLRALREVTTGEQLRWRKKNMRYAYYGIRGVIDGGKKLER